MSDRDRDELIEDIVDGHDQGFFPRAEMIADHLIERGWRRATVTPEQLLAVVQILDDVPAVRFPETWMRKARDIAHMFGLSMVEGETT